MKYFSYLNSAVDIIQLYKGQQPFHLFIKDFFRQHKKYGSSDRKQITHFCYCYFRLGASLQNITVAEKILSALFLCSDKDSQALAQLKPDYNEKVHLPLEEKCAFANISYDSLTIFPCRNEISNEIDKKDFISSHLIQPDVFLRIRPGQLQTVSGKLNQESVPFSLQNENCIRLSHSAKIDDIISLNKEAVVQDYNSQRTGDLLKLVTSKDSKLKVWDCCAASGGKSIMAKDILGNIDLTVSDVRAPIIINLKKRFAEAGIQNYKALVTDLSPSAIPFAHESFRLIIADVPCTGSGTWGRTPERLVTFDAIEIEKYTILQKKIVSAAMPYLQSGGFLLYITCSVFTKENEDIISFIRQNLNAELVKMEILKGYAIKADTMFAALLKRST